MTDRKIILTLASTACATTLALAGMFGVSTAAQSKSAAAAGIFCEVVESQTAYGVMLEATVSAQSAAAGTYKFAVQGNGGGMNINQGGPFAVAAGETALLGKVTLGNSNYDAKLSIFADGVSIPCDETSRT